MLTFFIAFSFCCSDWVSSTVFRFSDSLFCFISHAVEHLWCVFQFSDSILKVCDSCLVFSYIFNVFYEVLTVIIHYSTTGEYFYDYYFELFIK